MSRMGLWLDERLGWRRVWEKYATQYYLPKNLNVYYIFGALALLVLLNQLVTGLWLTMFYTPTADEAFNSIQYIMRDVSFGWLLRYMHSTGASAFFIVIYLHLFRGLLYGSYQKPRELVWFLGMFLFLLLTAEACFGYLLPWGQLSFWGAQVMTSLLGAIPYVGDALVTWVRGDYTVSDVTLHRFFALHIIGVPLLILLFVWLHLVALRQVGSNNPSGVEPLLVDKIPFHPYYTLKDAASALIFFMGFFAVVFFYPDMGGYFLEPLNLEPANPLVTPPEITPLWYMAPFYAMLRAIPHKLAGIVIMSSALLIFFFLPWLDNSPVRTVRNKGRYSQVALSLLVLSVLFLGYLGTHALTPVTLWMARLCTAVYFGYFLLMPMYTRYESRGVSFKD